MRASIDIEAVSNRVYRTDLFRVAAAESGVACPEHDRLPPGAHGEPLLPAVEPIVQEFPALLRSGD
jgi:nitrate/nitrite transport system substrate-binding protein